MPDANGDFVSTYFGLSAEAHARIFGSTSSNDKDVEIEWIPDYSIDGAVFIPECDCGDDCEDPEAEGCKNPGS